MVHSIGNENMLNVDEFIFEALATNARNTFRMFQIAGPSQNGWRYEQDWNRLNVFQSNPHWDDS